MKTAQQHPYQDWINFNEPFNHFKASFPYQPVHMQFDLNKEDGLNGSLEVYTTSSKNGVLMINIISSPSLEEYKKQKFTKDIFKKIFYSCFLRRLVYQPRVFKDNETFKAEEIQFQGQPALQFSINYQNNQDSELMSGLAILKEAKLFIILYIAPEKEEQHHLFHHFIESFQLESSSIE